MPLSQVSQVRLAPLDQPGSTVYNAYQFFSQIASLYTYGAESDCDAEHAGEWRWLCDSVLEDLGVLYAVWDASIKIAPGAPPPTVAQSLAQRIVRSCHRTDILARHLTVWTPISRWLRLLSLFELRWQHFLSGLATALAGLPVTVAPLQEASRGRLQKLDHLLQREERESERINTCFALVAQGNL